MICPSLEKTLEQVECTLQDMEAVLYEIRLLKRPDFTPERALQMAEQLDARIGALITNVNLLRHEAKLAIEARKGAKA